MNNWIQYEVGELNLCANSENWGNVKKEFYDLKKLIEKLDGERIARIDNEKKAKHIAHIRSLANHTQVYYTRNTTDPRLLYGQMLTKIKTNLKYILCTDGKTKWTIPPQDLTDVKPDESSIITNRNFARMIGSVKI